MSKKKVNPRRRLETTELGRFNAICREYGVTYGQGVAMGLKLQETPEESSSAEVRGWRRTKWKGGPIDCRKFAELYNRGCNTVEIAKELGLGTNAMYSRMNALCLLSNRTQGGKQVQNPKVTPEQLYRRAKAIGMPVVEGSVEDE